MDEPSWLSGAQPNNPELPIWTRSVVEEMLPDAVSPLSWTMVWQPGAALGWRDCMIERFGFDDQQLSAERPETVAVIDGYVYLNASLLRVWADWLPGTSVDDIDSLLIAGARPLPAHEAPDWDGPDRVTRRMLEQWREWVVTSRNQFELDQQIELVEETVGETVDLVECSDLDLVAEAQNLQPLLRELFSQHLNQTLAALIGPRILNEACQAVGQPAHTLRLLSGIGRIESVSPTLALWELSRLVRSSSLLNGYFELRPSEMEEVLRAASQADAQALMGGVDALTSEIGFRGPNEWDLMSPTWDVAPDVVLAMISSMRRCNNDYAPRRRRKQLEDDRYRLAVEIAGALEEDDRTRFLEGLGSSTTFLRGRERSRTAMMHVIHRMRTLVRELGHRGVRRNDFSDVSDVWLLQFEELLYYADGGLADVRDLTTARRLEQDQHREAEPPPYVVLPKTDNSAEHGELSERIEVFTDTAELMPGDVMLGFPGSPGMAQGPARVIESDDDLASFEPGEVIVLARPLLAATPLFVAAGAVVTDVGGTFSHAVVVARELGIPMVVGATKASGRIKTGSIVNVDGLTGVVAVVPGESAAEYAGEAVV